MGARFGLLAAMVALSVSSVALAGNGNGNGSNGGGNGNGGGNNGGGNNGGGNGGGNNGGGNSGGGGGGNNNGSDVAVVGICQDLAVLNNYCVFSGNINASASGNASYLLTEAAYNPLSFADIDLNPILSTGNGVGANGAFNPGSTTSGTWNLAGYNVDFIAIKGGNSFALYRTTGSSGTWSTSALVNGGGNTPGLSHLVFFGTLAAAVPEPSTWALMILGFGVAGASMRQRKARVLFA